MRKLLVIQVAGLGYDLLAGAGRTAIGALQFAPLETVFPAVTCTVQASFRTATLPVSHGMVANGFLERSQRRAFFWEQSAHLVAGERIWQLFRREGGRVALLFWQQSLGESADIVLSPAPIHKHAGGIVEDCYSKPAGLYADLCRKVGRKFRLLDYWGPLASAKSSAWIAEATAALLADSRRAPDLCLTYLPALDYDLQRHGPAHPRSLTALATAVQQIATLTEAAAKAGYEVLVFGDYAIGPCANGAILPNRVLREAGLFSIRPVERMAYPDLCSTPAFAVVDHEIAHVYVHDSAAMRDVVALFAGRVGVERVLELAEIGDIGLGHERAGDGVLVAAPGYWFAYPWWTEAYEAPDYASHVDIHNKPGYDPCELFFGWPPMTVSRDPARVRGSHGRTGPERRACWAATCPLGGAHRGLLDLAGGVRDWLEERL